MTGLGMWFSPPRGVIAAQPTASPSPCRAITFHRRAVARAQEASAAAAAFLSEYPSAPLWRAVAGGSPATSAPVGGAGLSPATGAAAPGRPREAENSRVPDALRNVRGTA